MTFVATENGLNPKEKHDSYEGKSLLRYSSEKLDLNKEIPEFQPMKKKAVGKVKYKGKFVVPPEQEVMVDVKKKKKPAKKPIDKAEIGKQNILPVRACHAKD